MTSKRLLEQLYIASKIGITSKENEKILKDYYKVVLKDLDELEKLKEENQVLLVNKNVAQGIAKKFKEENDKLKKAITLLKKKFVDVGLFIDCDDVGEYNFNRDSDEDRLSDFEFEFLKELI